jgi:hypothetical protein
MLKHKTKFIVIASVMVLFLLTIMAPITQANSMPTDKQASNALPETITMEQLLELTGSSLIDPTEVDMANLPKTLYIDTFENFGLSAEHVYLDEVVEQEQSRNHNPVSIILCLDEEFLGAYATNATAEFAAKNIIANAFTQFSSKYGIGYTIDRCVHWNTPKEPCENNL